MGLLCSRNTGFFRIYNIFFFSVTKENISEIKGLVLPDFLFEGMCGVSTRLDSKILYAYLLHKYRTAHNPEWVDKEGNEYIIIKRDEMCEALGCCKNTIIRMKKELKDIGIIYEKNLGSCSRHIYLKIPMKEN